MGQSQVVSSGLRCCSEVQAERKVRLDPASVSLLSNGRTTASLNTKVVEAQCCVAPHKGHRRSENSFPGSQEIRARVVEVTTLGARIEPDRTLGARPAEPDQKSHVAQQIMGHLVSPSVESKENQPPPNESAMKANGVDELLGSSVRLTLPLEGEAHHMSALSCPAEEAGAIGGGVDSTPAVPNTILVVPHPSQTLVLSKSDGLDMDVHPAAKTDEAVVMVASFGTALDEVATGLKNGTSRCTDNVGAAESFFLTDPSGSAPHELARNMSLATGWLLEDDANPHFDDAGRSASFCLTNRSVINPQNDVTKSLSEWFLDGSGTPCVEKVGKADVFFLSDPSGSP